MEESKEAEVYALQSKKNEVRSLFKKCFKNQIFSLVPFEIWRDLIVSSADLKSIVLLSQTCWGFKELFDEIGEKNFNLALMFRKEGQIVLAKKHLLRFVENKNSLAMLHLGYAYYYGGWGLDLHFKTAMEWFRKSAECDNAAAMAMYSLHCRGNNNNLSSFWANKALSSNDPFVVGFCYFYGLGTFMNAKKAIEQFEIVAKEGNELGQFYLAVCYAGGVIGCEKDEEKALYWHLKAAEQGFSHSQYRSGFMYLNGQGCQNVEGRFDIGMRWLRKAAAQGNLEALDEVLEIEGEEGSDSSIEEEES